MIPRRIALLSLCLLALAACSEGNAKKKPEPPPVPVKTAVAATQDIPLKLSAVGRAEAYESVSLKSRVDGQVAAVLFTEGRRVKQGDILIRLDPTDFAARLQQAEAAVIRDKALLAKATADTARYVALRERNFVSSEKVNEIRTNEAAASANLKASAAAEQVARLQLSYTTIRAPFSGVVGARLVFPGSSVKINDTVLAVVNRDHPLLVSFSVPEKHLPQIRAAMGAAKSRSESLRVDISLSGDKSRHYSGEAFFMDNAVDTTTGTILLKARLPNDKESLTPGQFVNVALRLDTLENAVTVPDEAVQQGPDGKFLYVVKDDLRVDMRQIETLASEAGVAAISKGLQAGETVVTDGQLRLAPGTRIAPSGSPEDSGKKPTVTSPAK